MPAHLKCLIKWLNKKCLKIDNEFITYWDFSEMNCDICKVDIPLDLEELQNYNNFENKANIKNLKNDVNLQNEAKFGDLENFNNNLQNRVKNSKDLKNGINSRNGVNRSELEGGLNLSNGIKIGELDKKENDDYILFDIYSTDSFEKKGILRILQNEKEKEKKFVVGRNENNDIIFKDISVSRIHSKIFFVKKKWFVEDQNSKFGTLFKLEEEIFLKDFLDENIIFGKYCLKFHFFKKYFCCGKNIKKNLKIPKIHPDCFLEEKFQDENLLKIEKKKNSDNFSNNENFENSRFSENFESLEKINLLIMKNFVDVQKKYFVNKKKILDEEPKNLLEEKSKFIFDTENKFNIKSQENFKINGNLKFIKSEKLQRENFENKKIFEKKNDNFLNNITFADPDKKISESFYRNLIEHEIINFLQ